jgi:hypothetical protein
MVIAVQETAIEKMASKMPPFRSACSPPTKKYGLLGVDSQFPEVLCIQGYQPEKVRGIGQTVDQGERCCPLDLGSGNGGCDPGERHCRGVSVSELFGKAVLRLTVESAVRAQTEHEHGHVSTRKVCFGKRNHDDVAHTRDCLERCVSAR